MGKTKGPTAPESDYAEEIAEGNEGIEGHEPDETWESVPEASDALAESGFLEETEAADEADDHAGVSSTEAAVELDADVDEAFLGEDEAGEEVTTAELESDLEMVDGYDESLIAATRESLAEAQTDERLLDAWYADLGDTATGVLLQQPGAMETIAEVVIGVDDRVRVTNTTAYPWRAICSLRITARDGSRWIGTGWLVGHRTVITAGHVVYIHSRGGWVRSIEVIPGRNSSTEPFGSCTATRFHSVKGWTQKRKRSHDYGAIILPSACDFGRRVGYFGYANYGFFTLLNMLVNLSGYPGDKPAGTQWWHARRIKWITSRTLVYNIDTAGGQSGSPVWRKKGNQRYAVGIHTNGSSSGNSATRITKAVFDNIKAWKQLGM